MKTVLAVLLWASLAHAGPSSTYLWIPNRPLYGIQTGSAAIYDSPNQACRSFLPTVSIVDATTMAWIITVASGVVNSTCTVTIYNAAGTSQVATSGPVICDTATIALVAALPAFTLVRGTKYQLCVCVSGGAPEFLTIAGDGASGGYFSLANLLSTPLRFSGGNSCDGAGNAPATIGTRSGQNRGFPYILLGTDTP